MMSDMLTENSAHIERRISVILCTAEIQGENPRSLMNITHWKRASSSVKKSFQFVIWDSWSVGYSQRQLIKDDWEMS